MSAIKPSWLENCRTLTGLSLVEAFARLDRELAPTAYKAIQGGKGGALGLTDIVPGYLPAELLAAFGPLGIGWGLEVVALESRAGKTSTNKDTWESTARIKVWYAYERSGELARSEALEVPGGSDNSERGWAEKGAITNALGAAWFFHGYQLSVYQGLRSHSTAGTEAAMTEEQDAEIGRLFKAAGITGDAALDYCEKATGKRDPGSLLKADADKLLVHLRTEKPAGEAPKGAKPAAGKAMNGNGASSHSEPKATPTAVKELAVAMTKMGLKEQAESMAWVHGWIGREVATRKDLTAEECAMLIEKAKNGEFLPGGQEREPGSDDFDSAPPDQEKRL